MERPSRGEVWVGEQDLARLPRKQIPFHRRHIGVVFQNHQLLFDRSVFDNVALPLQIPAVVRMQSGRLEAGHEVQPGSSPGWESSEFAAAGSHVAGLRSRALPAIMRSMRLCTQFNFNES